MPEACLKCRNIQNNIQEKEIKEEIRAFLKAPENFNIRFNPRTGFYKFELNKGE